MNILFQNLRTKRLCLLLFVLGALPAQRVVAGEQTSRPTTRVTIGDPEHPERLSQELQQAYDAGARTIVIRPGSYLLPYKNSDVFRLRGWKDATISASGVTLISSESEWNRNLFVLDKCTNVTLQGATLTQTTLSFYQGRILSVGRNEAGKFYIDWVPDAGYPVPTPDVTTFSCNIAEAATRKLKPGVDDLGDVRLSAGTAGTFRIVANDPQAPIVVGDVLVGRRGNAPFKVQLLGSRDCTLRNLTMSRNGFSPIREEGLGGGGNRILGCKWTPGPKPQGATVPPLVSGAADGIHSTSAYPGPRIENCRFEGIILDDPIAIHGYYQEVIAVTDKSLTLKAGYAGLEVGSPIRISDSKGFLLDSQVTALKPNDDQTVVVSISSEVVVPVGAKATNPLACGVGYRIVNNHIQGTRSRGILVKADNGLIRGNLIEDCGMSAISAGPEYDWNESDYVNGLRIENNIIRNNGSVRSAALWIHGEGANGNKNIHVAGNRFENNYRDDINAQWTYNLTISGNTFRSRQMRPEGFTARPFALSNTLKVTIVRNRILSHVGYEPEFIHVGKEVEGLQTDLASSFIK